jgi:hypothetical protein
VDRREFRDDIQGAPKLRLQLGQCDVRPRLGESAQIPLLARHQPPAMAAKSA